MVPGVWGVKQMGAQRKEIETSIYIVVTGDMILNELDRARAKVPARWKGQRVGPDVAWRGELHVVILQGL